MLDKDTKRRIDDCRDILVGKLPDPKSQIEQITIALIYKFMDDMDKEAVELGGTAKFFSGDYAQYAWDALFDTKVSSADLVKLYADALESMDLNQNIPELFRNIFKNAYLPYRDPETLRLFLKTIGGFAYTHSEKLGDAFEYLLSVMGSQGDAGQFRTPRHIIDFVVAVVDPGKKDKVLDPACGTAGFLISAYKHIKDKSKGQLTPDERKRLIQNFVGYDISPDMVRLSLVNLYLHDFSDPHIFEYDSLSSEDNWDENFDVILANPPFMTPKGGIRPHKRFTISSNRAEVLFVDYIAEHLNPKGRAGIIVPEGVIFQSGKAYKALRKMLVENSLYAVVSLPAGVFNPYSGVKTSVLLMDKTLAKKQDEILFVRIDNDGFNLGSQRSIIKGGQLEEAITLIGEFREDVLLETTIAHAVPKAQIAKDGDYNLSGERYKTVIERNSTYNYIELGEVAEITSSKRILKEEYVDEGIPFYRTKEIVELNQNKPISLSLYISRERFLEIKGKFGVPRKGDILISAVGTLGIPWLIDDNRDFYFKDGNLIWIKNIKGAVPSYIKNVLEVGLKNKLGTLSIGAAYRALTIVGLKRLEIPLPPLSIQEEIVAEIEDYQKIIDGARMVVKNYKPQIKIDPEWEMVELGKHCKIRGGNAFKSIDYVDKGVQLIRMGNVRQRFFDVKNSPSYLPPDYLESNPNYILTQGDLLVSMTGTIGKEDYGNVCQIDTDNKYLLNQRVGKFEILTELLDRQFLYYVANTDSFRKQLFANSSGGVRQSNISNKGIERISIPLPPLEIQQQIVAQLEKEQALVNANKELIEIYEQKIKDKIGEVWGEEPK